MSTVHDNNALANETTKVEHNYDLESGHPHGNGIQGGAPLGRQISVQLTEEQYERLFLQTGGKGTSRGLSSVLANPTPLGVASFLLCLTPFSCDLMGWAGATNAAAAVTIGAFYFVGGLGLTLAGVFEMLIGNTFPATVFTTFGGFWLAFAYLLAPMSTITQAVAADSVDYNAGLALYLVWWGVLVIIYFIASLRTNVVFVALFFFLDITFWLLVATYLNISNAKVDNLQMMLKASGAFGFLTCVCGWYLLLVLVLGSTGFPLALPVGDLSGFLSRKPKQA